MKITVLIFGLLAILSNHFVLGEPIKENNKISGSVAPADVVIGSKNPKRDSSDQTAVEDKTGQSQNYQPQGQYQHFIPIGQYFSQAATQQVHYAKPEGNVAYAKPHGGVQYVSSTHRPAAYQTIAYSAHHANGQPQNNGKIVAQIAPAQYNPAPVQYYAIPQHAHQHQQHIQYAIAIPTGNGHQQLTFAALPGHGHNSQQGAQFAFAVQPQIIYRGEASNGHYSGIPPPPNHIQAPKYAILIAAAPQQSQLGYPKYSTGSIQPQTIFYAAHPGHNYYPGQSANHGYYQHQIQPAYQHVQPAYGIQPGVQYTSKPIQVTSAPVSVTPTAQAPAINFKNYVTTAASNGNHNGATSFSTYAAQLPVNQHNGGGQIQVVKAPVTYATTAAPIVPYQQTPQNGGASAKIYYTSIPAQYQEGGQGYAHHGTVQFGQHLYHPPSSKSILIPSAPASAHKY